MNTNTIALTPCPFCGKSDTLVIGKASDVFAEPDECGDPLPYMHTESYAVTCDASKPDGPGGCGASGGYKLTEAEAVSAWNARAAIAALEQAEEPFGWVSRADDGAVMLELNGDQRINDGDAVYRAKPFAALEAEPQPEADMFWDGDDPEIFGHDIQELAAERGPGQVFSVDRAMRLPSIKVRVIAGETEDDENTWEEILPTPPKD